MAAVSTRSHAHPDPGFVTVQEITSARGVSGALVRRRLREAGLEPLRDPHDRRRRWIRAEDVSQLFAPQVAARPRKEGVAA